MFAEDFTPIQQPIEPIIAGGDATSFTWTCGTGDIMEQDLWAGIFSFMDPDGFDPNVDYCGTSWFDAPDVINGISIAEACYNHDLNYGPQSTMDRYEADMIFLADIAELLVDGGMSEGEALTVAMIYHTAVREFGIFAYEGQGNPQ